MHRLAAEAEADLDEIWLGIARKSGDPALAQRVVLSITERFSILADNPHLGRSRDADFGPGRRSFTVESYVIVYSIVGGDVLILRVAHGRRDLKALLTG